MSNKNDRSRRAIGKALKDIECGTAKQNVKTRKRRSKKTYNVGDYIKSGDQDYPSVRVKGELPYLTFNQMCWFSRRDRKYHFHHRLQDMTLKGMPPEVQKEFRGLLIKRLVRKNVFHQKFKFIEGTLRAFEKKYS